MLGIIFSLYGGTKRSIEGLCSEGYGRYMCTRLRVNPFKPNGISNSSEFDGSIFCFKDCWVVVFIFFSNFNT